MTECPDCGASNMQVLGFACYHERCPMAQPALMPPCMMPDGGECCPQYHDLKKENSQLRNLLEAVREENQRLRVQIDSR